MSRLSYRPEIDGLRAVAVLSVILYHAEIILFGRNWVEGGYIGVDIFFVISGYLITRIILSELYEKGSFDFLYFYERRARRILPMLLVLGLFCLAVGWKILLPDDYEELSKSIVSSLSFWSNLYFYIKSIDYNAQSALLKPFLHTWSLSVEEQFYLIFPVFAVISFKYFRPFFLPILAVLLLLSLQFSETIQETSRNFNFYLPYSRFWELAVGAFLAFRELNKNKEKQNKFGGVGLPVFGVFLLGYSIFFFDNSTPYPGFYTVLPILGVALIIGFASKDEWVGRILGSKWLVGPGLISYSAYLWHFPIMAFWRIADKNVGLGDQVFWVGASFGLAVISYHLIEQPFRNRTKFGRKHFFIILAGLGAFSLAVNYSVIAKDGFENRVPSFYNSIKRDTQFINRKTYRKCHQKNKKSFKGKIKFCTVGDGKKKFYLVGNSNMGNIIPNLAGKMERSDGQLVIMTAPASALGNNYTLDRARIKVLSKAKNSVVILGGIVLNRRKKFFERVSPLYSSVFEQLISNGNRIVLIYPIPSTKIDRKRLFVEYQINGRLLEKKSNRADFDRGAKLAYDFYNGFTAPDILRVFPEDYFCEGQYCYGVRNEKLLLRDNAHPSQIGSAWIVKQIFEKLEQ